MGNVENAVQWMEAKAADPSCGYDQDNRWGPNYDCSSFVITAFSNAGIPLKSKGATYTGNLASALQSCGFQNITSSINKITGSGLKRGDVLLNSIHHVAVYTGNGHEVEASINEKRRATGGKSGDQIGNTFGKGEVLVRKYRNYPWTSIWRYTKSTETPTVNTPVPSTAPTVLWYGKVTASSLNVREYPHTEAKILGRLRRDELVAVEENSHWYKIGADQWVCADYIQTGIPAHVCRRGIDVSTYQGNIDWNAVKADGIDFAILRGVEKSGNLDVTFEQNYTNAFSAGVEIKGAYHYLYALNEQQAIEAANNMIEKLAGKQLTIWLDLEWQNLRSTNRVTEIANAYIDTCKTRGYDIGVYSNLDWYNNVYSPIALHTQKFWIARYANSGKYKESLKPNVGELIWQWSSKGTVKGINGMVDMDIFYEGNLPSSVVTASQLNIRSLPCTTDPNCKIIGSLKRGDTISVVKDSLWYKIQTQSVIGWCSSSYIKKNG